MAAKVVHLLIPGEKVSPAAESHLGGLLDVTSIGSHRIAPSSRGAPAPEVPAYVPEDALIKLEYQSGLTEWLRVGQFVAELGQQRSSGPVHVPVTLDRGADATRGAAEWALKGLHLFGITPTGSLAAETAETVIHHFETRLNTGLFRIRADGSLGDCIGTALTDSSAAYLVFLHGTASSTQGSFSGLWSDAQTSKPTPEWEDLAKTYGERILALEHRTFSVSPAQNALDLVRLLPDNSTIHLIAHSRGGLVGELLGLGSLTDDDLRRFEGRPDAAVLTQLRDALSGKQIRIAKFVRTACPAAGTILASNRLDIYLNVILNLLGLIPGLSENPAYEVFKATALELIKLRADPAKIPGIEAQMPESPLIHLLNTRGRYSSADLGVVAGSFRGAGVWGALKSYATRAYYWEDHDLVVQTRSMCAGMDRQKGVWQFRDEGGDVNHFSYFKNARTRTHMLQWLAAPPAQPAADFTRVRGVARSGVRGASHLPLAFLLPDVFGTHLQDGRGNVWLDYDALAQGRFQELAAAGLQPGLIHEIYRPLLDQLALTHEVAPFPYDWRAAASSIARQLADAVRKELGASGRPVRFVAHGMGGLVVRELARQDPASWRAWCGETGGVLMLGTPSFGSWRIARMLAGRSRLVRMLALLGRHTTAEVARILQGFRGLLDLLPAEMHHAHAWAGEQSGCPDPALLDASASERAALRDFAFPAGRIVYVAGSAAATPAGLTEYTSDGDGDAAYRLALLPDAQTWYSPDASHGDLVRHPAPVVELLNTGATGALRREARSRASLPDAHRLLQLEQAVLFPDEADLAGAAFELGQERAAPSGNVLRVSVCHGHLRDAQYPVAAGHYSGDGIVSAEAELDRQLAGRLSARFHMDLYPGPAGTADVTCAPDAHPPGALIVGLGEVGDITPERVRKGVSEACLRYALMRAETPAAQADAPRSAAFSSLLIGASGGRAIGIGESVIAVVRAAIDANRILRRRGLSGQVYIDEVEFIEIYEDAAAEAVDAAARLPRRLQYDLEPDERIEFDGRLKSRPGGRPRRPANNYDSGWWRRIQIAAAPTANPDGARETATALVFEALTDRARAEQTLAAVQTGLVDSLLADATNQPSYDEAGGVALFELLVPNALKDQANEEAHLLLVLDAAAARYPWELMAVRQRDRIMPLALRAGMIRQLKTPVFRAGPRGSADRNAFVAGDTISDLPELPGAQNEAQAVASVIQGQGYSVTPLLRQDPLTIVRELFAREYRIVHLAGHGVYDAADPARSGMVLGKGVYLTPLELSQIRTLPELVFINCCYLGTIGRQLHVSQPHRMAASVAQSLIGMGVKAVVAAGWAVDDRAAAVFAQTFYREMLGGRRFGESVLTARQAARAQGANNTWGAYQCYGNPDFALTIQGAVPAAV